MFELVPLDLVDNILLDYHVGHALLAGFVLAVLGAIPLGSRRILSLNVVLFGLIFLIVPSSQVPAGYKLFGLVLLVLGPVLYSTARR